MTGLAGTQPAQAVGAAATRYASCLFAEEVTARPPAPVATGWHLSPTQGGVEPMAKQGEHATRLAAPLNLEIVAGHPFRAKGFFSEGRRGWVGHCEVPPSEMRALPAATSVASDAGVSIWVIEKGHLVLEHPSAGPAPFGPGSVLLWDSLKPLRGYWDHARFGYVRLSPPRNKQSLEYAASTEVRTAQRLEHLGLAPFLAAQLSTFANHATALTAADLCEVVGGIVQVAEALLKVVFAPLASDGASTDTGRLQAVHCYIEHNLHRHDLSVADIARGTSMSRAQLYRLFATQETSVHGTLREMRLQKSLGYLAQSDGKRQSIGAIGHACGFSDPAVFSKLFRQRFDLAPRDVRAAAGLAK
ncbi:AraC-like DNA-binding protein [Variovorax boronicumulans]|uniref:AraC family transcriptional regulator n=1 Tax=Variovorax boronicumulans TaxID=436515 RepID=UPI0027812965|nr:helix-turn-helix domain-containing protein [Variovorax boronicumulans]MDQ0036833.1 AraC-like DNA-binding protein [Variovorax boronicumulans]